MSLYIIIRLNAKFNANTNLVFRKTKRTGTGPQSISHRLITPASFSIYYCSILNSVFVKVIIWRNNIFFTLNTFASDFYQQDVIYYVLLPPVKRGGGDRRVYKDKLS